MTKKEKEGCFVLLIPLFILGVIVQILEQYGMVILYVLIAIAGLYVIGKSLDYQTNLREEKRKLKKKILGERRKVFASLVFERSHEFIPVEDTIFINEYIERVQNKSNRNRTDFINSINKVKQEISAIAQKNNLPKLAPIVGKSDRFIASSKQNYDHEIDKLNKGMTHSKVSYLMVSEYGIRVEKVTIAHRKVLVAALNKLLKLKSKINAYLVHREKMRVDMLFEKENMSDDTMSKQILEEINLTGAYVDDLIKASKVVFD